MRSATPAPASRPSRSRQPPDQIETPRPKAGAFCFGLPKFRDKSQLARAPMRKDMSKIIVERPRIDSGPRRKGRSRPLTDADGAPYRARDRDGGHERPQRTKHLNENLAPLRRFLQSNVGRPWNKVRSELAENIRPTSTVQQHVLDHVTDFVATKTVMREGKVMVFDSHSRRHPVPVQESWALLYVHPKSGLLMKNRS